MKTKSSRNLKAVPSSRKSADRAMDPATVKTFQQAIETFVDSEAPNVEDRLEDLKRELFILSSATRPDPGTVFPSETLDAISDRLRALTTEIDDVLQILPAETLFLKRTRSDVDAFAKAVTGAVR